MYNTKKFFLELGLSLTLVALTLLIFLPYFTSDFLDQRQKIENEEIHQRLLKEEQVKKEAEEKIYLTGKFDPAEREDFALVQPQYSLSGNKIYLREEAYEAFLDMANSADKDEIELKIASATRNFDYQKDLWNNKWIGTTPVEGKNLSKSIPGGQQRFEKILEYSAVPGTSRHHWGTDIDINGATPEYFDEEKGVKEYYWLTQNAYMFGFCQTYNQKGGERLAGYNEEKWHWSYLPLARGFTKRYAELIKDNDIKDFDGDEYAPGEDLIYNYVLSINSECI